MVATTRDALIVVNTLNNYRGTPFVVPGLGAGQRVVKIEMFNPSMYMTAQLSVDGGTLNRGTDDPAAFYIGQSLPTQSRGRRRPQTRLVANGVNNPILRGDAEVRIAGDVAALFASVPSTTHYVAHIQDAAVPLSNLPAVTTRTLTLPASYDGTAFSVSGLSADERIVAVRMSSRSMDMRTILNSTNWAAAAGSVFRGFGRVINPVSSGIIDNGAQVSIVSATMVNPLGGARRFWTRVNQPIQVQVIAQNIANVNQNHQYIVDGQQISGSFSVPVTPGTILRELSLHSGVDQEDIPISVPEYGVVISPVTGGGRRVRPLRSGLLRNGGVPALPGTPAPGTVGQVTIAGAAARFFGNRVEARDILLLSETP